MKKIVIKNKLVLLSLLGTSFILSGCKDASTVEVQPLTNTATEFEMPETKSSGSIIFDANLKEQTYNYEEIENIINNNSSLTEDEKNFIKKLKFVFDDNNKYMDLDLIKERLSSIKFEYIGDYDVDSIGGLYYSNNNTITIIDATNINDAPIDVVVHEFLHSLQERNSHDFTVELSNEFFSREIVRKLYEDGLIDETEELKTNNFGDGYNDYMCLYNTLAELVDEETLRKYQFLCDKNTLIKGVSYTENGILPQERIEYFIELLNNSRVYNEEENIYVPFNNYDLNDVLIECFDSLDYYFVEKYGYNIKDNFKVSIYFMDRRSISIFNVSGIGVLNDEEYDVLDEMMIEKAQDEFGENATMFGAIRTVTPRTFLSDDHLNTTITFNSPAYTTVEIDDTFIDDFNNRLSEKNNTLSH